MKRKILVLVIIIGLLVWYFYFNKDNNNSDASIKLETNSDYRKINNEDDIAGEFQSSGVKNTDFNRDDFYSFIKTNYCSYGFKTEEDQLYWIEDGNKLKVSGLKLYSIIDTGNYKIFEESKTYLLDKGFELDNGNIFGSDAGDSLQGFKKGNNVCVLKTEPTEKESEAIFTVNCGEL